VCAGVRAGPGRRGSRRVRPSLAIRNEGSNGWRLAPLRADAFDLLLASASTDPHCTVDPGTVPKAMDVLTPAGISQADELDYTLHSPVTIAPVVVP
jgi:hypothetical protein